MRLLQSTGSSMNRTDSTRTSTNNFGWPNAFNTISIATHAFHGISEALTANAVSAGILRGRARTMHAARKIPPKGQALERVNQKSAARYHLHTPRLIIPHAPYKSSAPRAASSPTFYVSSAPPTHHQTRFVRTPRLIAHHNYVSSLTSRPNTPYV